MNSDLLWFVFHLVFYYYELHHSDEYGWGDAIAIASRDLNKVIIRHNEAYWAQQQGKWYWHDTSDYTDNQCVFSSLLRHDQEYKLIDIAPCLNCGQPAPRNRQYCNMCHTMGIDI